MDPRIKNRKLFTLILLTIGNFFVASCWSILNPFFPFEAEKKGASATEYGMCIGILELMVFITSPFYGKYLHKLGPRLVLNLGMLTEAIGCIAFGLLDNCDGHNWFISLSFFFRIIQGIGSSAYATASFAVISIEFPEKMAQTFAGLETAFGAGLIGGPIIGGLLFELGGYQLPFLVMGGLLLISAILSPFLTPPQVRDLGESSYSLIDRQDSTGTTRSKGIIELIKIPGAAFAALNVMSSAISNSLICTILEPHIRQFNLSPVGVTGVFVMLMGTYALTTNIFGWICGKLSVTNFVSLFGSTAMAIGCMLIGPAPFLPFNTILWVTCVGCALQGLGTGALNVSSFLQLIEWSKKNGFPDDIRTYGITSGIWFSMLSCGNFLGPFLGGVLYDHKGFRMTSLLCIVEHGFMIILQTIFIIWIWKKNKFTKTSQRRASLIADAYESLPLLQN